jgi:N-acetylmuramoyl-L-alanine amidase
LEADSGLGGKESGALSAEARGKLGLITLQIGLTVKEVLADDLGRVGAKADNGGSSAS